METENSEETVSLEEQIPLKPKEKIVWEWKDNLVWKEFDQETNEILEATFQNPKLNSILLVHGFYAKDTYTVVVKPTHMMKQTNNKTRFSRDVRRVSDAPGSLKRKREDDVFSPSKMQSRKSLC